VGSRQRLTATPQNPIDSGATLKPGAGANLSIKGKIVSNIPSKSDVAKQDADAAAAQARQRRADDIKRLTDALVDAIQRKDWKPNLRGVYPQDVIDEVARDFQAKGWTIRRTGGARNQTSFDTS